ncbi:hypothetical protein BT96DRAFT_1001071 [Gymnopus androsaceus JB14]|uniref:Secreted protein n=1 Tax=Gymnopus androsaceus JB14 TaxID=1447944 RepID=A0A6A4H215_9AGAR|nr:hypothetical protein BT96DRAFT_1001071 [Gymnopus androsaceus JB14]
MPTILLYISRLLFAPLLAYTPGTRNSSSLARKCFRWSSSNFEERYCSRMSELQNHLVGRCVPRLLFVKTEPLFPNVLAAQHSSSEAALFSAAQRLRGFTM